MRTWGVVLKIEPLPLASGPMPYNRFVRVLISARRTASDGMVLVQSLILPEADAELLRVGRIASVAVEMDAEKEPRDA